MRKAHQNKKVGLHQGFISLPLSLPLPHYFCLPSLHLCLLLLQCPASCCGWHSLPSLTPLSPPLYFPHFSFWFWLLLLHNKFPRNKAASNTFILLQFCSLGIGKSLVGQLSFGASHLVEVAAGWECSHLKEWLGWTSKMAQLHGWQWMLTRCQPLHRVSLVWQSLLVDFLHSS